ncbi:DUF58 domain-containing protein [Candidatus Acetothermia bacterium]|nr:DUF58 domain-containing protein [Candidatus Acetothermia bacterium]MBI3643279.1 DUF58 domain-containing protein [Candidatus Acetothermia bacterium]
MPLLLDSAYLKKLENLGLVIRGRFHGYMTGKRLTSRSGMSLEFAEYKEYSPGDDFRYVDWNLYGRLGKLFVKRFNREEDVPIYLFLDISHSMAIGEKLNYAVLLAGTLAYLGLKEFNRVGIFPFASDLALGVPPKGSYKQLFQIFHFLEKVVPAGETSINESLTRFTRIRRESGLAVIISDMLSEDGFEEGLAQLLYHGYEVIVLHLLAPDDLNPAWNGEIRLKNIEDQKEITVHVDRAALNEYQTALDNYRSRLEAFCRERGIRYALVSTDSPLEKTVFETLREGALVQ